MVLDAGCDIEGRTLSAETPLLIASNYGHYNVLDVLLNKYNANSRVVDWKGISPLKALSNVKDDMSGNSNK